MTDERVWWSGALLQSFKSFPNNFISNQIRVGRWSANRTETLKTSPLPGESQVQVVHIAFRSTYDPMLHYLFAFRWAVPLRKMRIGNELLFARSLQPERAVGAQKGDKMMMQSGCMWMLRDAWHEIWIQSSLKSWIRCQGQKQPCTFGADQTLAFFRNPAQISEGSLDDTETWFSEYS